jgi:hypothetical protein
MGTAAGGCALVTEGAVSSKVSPVIEKGGFKDTETLAPGGGWIIVLVDAQASPSGGRGGAFWLAEPKDDSPKFATFERRKYAALNSSSCVLKPGSSISLTPCVVFEPKARSVALWVSLLSCAFG